MPHRAITALAEILRPEIALSKSRLETLCLVVAMVSARTVNLSHLAAERSGDVLIASTYRRLQRFFQYVRLPSDWAAPLIGAMLQGARSWDLALDRTNWRVGAADINFLVLAIVTPRYRVPLMWQMLDGPGNSSTAQRIALMRRFLAPDREFIGAVRIRWLLADREFIGAGWSMLRIIAIGQRIERVMLRKRCLDPLPDYVSPSKRNPLSVSRNS